MKTYNNHTGRKIVLNLYYELLFYTTTVQFKLKRFFFDERQKNKYLKLNKNHFCRVAQMKLIIMSLKKIQKKKEKMIQVLLSQRKNNNNNNNNNNIILTIEKMIQILKF